MCIRYGITENHKLDGGKVNFRYLICKITITCNIAFCQKTLSVIKHDDIYREISVLAEKELSLLTGIFLFFVDYLIYAAVFFCPQICRFCWKYFFSFFFVADFLA